MIRWHCKYRIIGDETMPEFTTVSVQEAQVRTSPGRQGTFMNEYVAYIQQLPAGQAGRLRLGEGEKHPTIRRRLVAAANALGISLVIKRSGNDLYFWRENGGEDVSSKRRYTRRARTDEETPIPDQPFSGSEEVNHEATLREESPELGQTPL
jgi:hypothetical protein